MSKRGAPGRTGIWLIALSSITACEGPAGPSPTLNLEVTVPRSIAPGATVQLSATVVYSDGRRRDVTTAAVWTSLNTSILTVASSGLATGHAMGDTRLHVNYQETIRGVLHIDSASQDVIVIPSGTFKLIGSISSPLMPQPLSGVAIELTAEDGQVMSMLTDTAGFRFYGVSGRVRLRVSQRFHQPYDETIDVTDHLHHDVRLALTDPGVNIAGTYTLTITASDSCKSALPPDARIRSYTAVVNQRGPLVDVSLRDATFFNNANRFFGSFDATGRPGLSLEENPEGVESLGAEVIEQLDAASLFTPIGLIVLQVSADRLEGPLDGRLELRRLDAGIPVVVATCKATDHRVTFVK
jgi:hypothetical protein